MGSPPPWRRLTDSTVLPWAPPWHIAGDGQAPRFPLLPQYCFLSIGRNILSQRKPPIVVRSPLFLREIVYNCHAAKQHPQRPASGDCRR